MKKTIFLLSIIFALFLSVRSAAETVSGSYISSVSLDGDQITVEAGITGYYVDSSAEIGLFRVLLPNEPLYFPLDVKNAESKLSFTVSAGCTDTFDYHYGYMLGVRSGDIYLPITDISYISDLSGIAQFETEPSVPISKKGLQVQYITDAQHLGITSSTCFCYIDRLFSDDESKSVPFVYGGETYLFSSDEVASLDHILKVYSLAGITPYMYLLLDYSSALPADCYYQEAEKNGFCMPNIENEASLRRFCACVSFLSGRYAGLCGNFILGYEINNESGSNRAGITDLSHYADSCAALLTHAIISAKTAQSGARVFTSVSNLWVSGNAECFGARDLLEKLLSDVEYEFFVSVNAYPSDLSAADYETVTDSTDGSEYITMSNLSVISDFIGRRKFIVGETGISGKYGEESEKSQADGYVYAFEKASEIENLEAMIWHRHTDHSGEDGLCFGIYSSSEIFLEAAEKKLIHGEIEKSGGSTTVSAEMKNGKPGAVIFDFSKDTCGFYPSDNCSKLGLYDDGDGISMRIVAVKNTASEAFGGGRTIPASLLLGGSSVNVTLRLNGSDGYAGIMLICGENRLFAEKEVADGETVTLSLDSKELTDITNGTGNCIFKIYGRNGLGNGGLSLDVISVSLSGDDYGKIIIIGGAALFVGLASAFTAFIMTGKRKKDESGD